MFGSTFTGEDDEPEALVDWEERMGFNEPTLTEDAKRLVRWGITTCKPNCGCLTSYDVKACRDYDAGVRLIQNYRQPIIEDDE